MRFSGTSCYALPWMQDDLDEIEELFDGDPYPYGLEPNRKTVATLVSYLADQGFLLEKVPIEELFEPLHVTNE